MKFASKLKAALAGGVLAAAMLPGVSHAGIDFIFNWAARAGLAGTSPVTDELKFTAESVVHFTSGTPFTAGATFQDYVVLRVDQLFNNGNNVTPANYGAPGGDREITIIAQLSGLQTSATTYSITGFSRFDVILDGGVGFSLADFGNVATFTNGTIVEGSTGVSGFGLNSAGVPDGTVDIFVQLLDLVSPSDFELGPQGQSLGSHLLGVTNSNNALCGTIQTCFSTPAAILALFGVPVPASNFFHTRSDGSIEKLVPEPSSLALIGIALLGAAALKRRRAA